MDNVVCNIIGFYFNYFKRLGLYFISFVSSFFIIAENKFGMENIVSFIMRELQFRLQEFIC